MPNHYNVIELSANTPEELMVRFYDYHVRLQNALDKPPKTQEAYTKRAQELLAMPLRRECIIEHNELITGRIDVEAYNTSTTEKCIQISGELLDKIEDAGFYKTIKQLINKWQTEFGAPHAFIKSATPYNRFLVDFLKGELLDEQRYMQINIADIDKELLQEWMNNTHVNGLREEIYTARPEKYLQQSVTVINNGLRDIPNNLADFTPYFSVEEERTIMENRKKANTIQLIIMLFNPDERIVGYSNALIWHNNTTAGQALTYVARDYRNRGLAKYLKAKITLHIASNYPQIKVITTDCYVRNLPMIHINELAGFKYTRSGFDFSIRF